ncbi:MAG: hypothetical protein CDV28_11757 [Candidatus Electronema aureum]|uniref:Uncharacterized protein n=1 Tax=Candidatus Electronema aureum TaxID=2005002 RepID=A0A521G1S8_9BACT|nr:MAG: hypothetical protein CDV28_11757 [Candidatus Electronema aureum]
MQGKLQATSIQFFEIKEEKKNQPCCSSEQIRGQAAKKLYKRSDKFYNRKPIQPMAAPFMRKLKKQTGRTAGYGSQKYFNEEEEHQ